MIGLQISPLARWLGGVALAATLLAAAYVQGRRDGGAAVEARQAIAALAAASAARDRTAAMAAAEAARLAQERVADDAVRAILDEVAADPDGGAPALGLRDAQRLNAIR